MLSPIIAQCVLKFLRDSQFSKVVIPLQFPPTVYDSSSCCTCSTLGTPVFLIFAMVMHSGARTQQAGTTQIATTATICHHTHTTTCPQLYTEYKLRACTWHGATTAWGRYDSCQTWPAFLTVREASPYPVAPAHFWQTDRIRPLTPPPPSNLS